MAHAARAIVFALFVTLMACGGGGGGTAGSAGAGVQVFLQDAPTDQLDSFVVTFSSLTLVAQGGGGVSLLSGSSLQVNLLDLVMVQQLLASASVPAGFYNEMDASVTAIAATAGGVAQSVTLAGGAAFPMNLRIVFEHPLELGTGSQTSIKLDFDVFESCEDAGGTSIVVGPVIMAETESETETEELELDEFKGMIQSVNLGAGTFTVGASEDGVALGTMTVQVSAATLFKAMEDFFAAGMSGMSLLFAGHACEVKGSSVGGRVNADFVELEGSSEMPIKFKGVVTAVGGGTAAVKIIEVERDLPNVLAGVSSVNVNIGSAAFKAELGSNPDAGDVEVGEKLKIRGTGNVAASLVRLEDTRFEGTITAVGGNSITLSVVKAENAALSFSRTFSIPTSTEISIGGNVPCSVSNLATGQYVRLRGVRNVDTDQWVALKIQRRAGHFDGLRSAVSSIGTSSFFMTGDGTDLGLSNPVGLLVQATVDTEIVLVQSNQCTQVSLEDLASTLSNLAGSAKVRVRGVLGDGSTINASRIVLKP